jgi:dihydroflavonol-4-reductase
MAVPRSSSLSPASDDRGRAIDDPTDAPAARGHLAEPRGHEPDARATSFQGRGPVLVTGGTGFLGQEIVCLLCASGAEVHVLARASADRAALTGLDVHWKVGDLCDELAIDRAVGSSVEEAQARDARLDIVHCAALISYKSGDRARARAVNVAGTRALLDSAKRHDVRRFVYVSSVVTVGHSLRGEVLDERTAFNSARLHVDYVDTKREAEELVLAASRELDGVVVNPGAIFGPVDRVSNTVRFIRQIAAGRPPPFAPPGSISVVGVHDAARGTLSALERGRRGERYLLVESHRSTRELLNEMAALVGGVPVKRSLPRAAWRALTLCAAGWDRVFPMEATPPQALRMLGVDLRFDAAKARAELEWSPRPFREVLLETVAHMRERGWLGPIADARIAARSATRT